MTNLYTQNEPGSSDQAPQQHRGRADGAAEALRSAGKGNLLLAGVLVAGLVSVWILGMRGGPSEATGDVAEQGKTDALLTHLSQKTGDTDDGGAVDERYFDAAPRQIPLERVRANPFKLTVPRPPEPEAKPERSGQTPAPSRRQKDKPTAYEQALAEARGLELQTVLTDADGRAMAMISNNLLTEGQVIAGWKVASISPERVTLQWRDKSFVLSLR